MKMMVVLLTSVSVAAAVAVLVKREPVDAPASSSTAPAAPSAPAAADGDAIGGQVREAFDVAEYTYLRLQRADGAELWAAVTKAPVTVGSTVAIANAARMTNFHSASLKRTFDVIYFGNLEGASAHSARTLPPGHPEIAGHAMPGHGAAAMAAPPPVAVAPASGANARTIAALFAERASLAGQKVRVQGQVFKSTPVQGLSYVRLRDGSSTDAASSELVVSSRDAAKVGEVVTFEGTVGLDVDVGIGTKYPVMLQEAKRAQP